MKSRQFLKNLTFSDYLLNFLILFHLISNLIWINLNKLPFPWDQAGHTILTFKFLDFFQGKAQYDFLRISDYYPPFTHLIVAFFMSIFGRDPNIGPVIVTSSFVISILFIYLYASELFRNEQVAILSATIYSFLPVNYNLSRYFLLESPLLMTTTASLYFLEKTQNFQIRKYVIIFSLFAAFALFIKWTAVIFLFIPTLLKIIKNFNSRNILTALLIILAINFFWYSTNAEVLINATKVTATAEESDPKLILSFENFKYYFHLMANFQLTWVGMVAFLISLISFIKSYKKKSLILIAPIIFSYLVFTLIGNKDLRYIIGLLPFISVILGFGIYKLIKYDKFFAWLGGLTLLLYFIVYFFSLSFGFPIDPIRDNIRSTIFIPGFGGVDLINLSKDSSFLLAPKYSPTVWPNSIIVNELSNFDPKNKVNILVIAEKPFFNQVNLELARREIDKNKIEFFAPYNLTPLKNNQEIENYLSRFHLVLLANKDLGPQGGIRHIEIMKQLKKYLETETTSQAKRINRYYLPDGDTIIVYKTVQWPNLVIAEELSRFNPTKDIKILTVFDKKLFNQRTLEDAKAELGKEKIEFLNVDPRDTFKSEQSLESYLLDFDVLLVSDKNFGDLTIDSKNLEQISEFVKSGLTDRITKINTYYLPDGDTISVFKTLLN